MTTPSERLVDDAVKCNACGAAFGACDCADTSTRDCPPVATHSGIVTIGDIELKCHVLSNGVRIFDADSVYRFLHGLGADDEES